MQTRAQFVGAMERFAEVRGFVEEFARAAGLDHDRAQRLVLVLEELFTNTATHGHGHEGPAGVWIDLEATAGSVRVIYEDTAPAFDPFTGAPCAPPGPPTMDGPPGGFGLALVRGLCASSQYQRCGHRNRVTLLLGGGARPSRS